MTSINRKLSLEEVLDEFFFFADAPSPAMVARACDTYPEYREDIMEFAALWSAYKASPEPTDDAIGEISEESVERLQSFALNLLHNRKQESAPRGDVDAARVSIEGLAGRKLRLAAQAASLGDSTLLLQKVITKRIYNTPRIVLTLLAQHLNVASDALESLLGPQLIGSINYKSSDKPNVQASESWEEAVGSLPVDDNEKTRLLALGKGD